MYRVAVGERRLEAKWRHLCSNHIPNLEHGATDTTVYIHNIIYGEERDEHGDSVFRLYGDRFIITKNKNDDVDGVGNIAFLRAKHTKHAELVANSNAVFDDGNPFAIKPSKHSS